MSNQNIINSFVLYLHKEAKTHRKFEALSDEQKDEMFAAAATALKSVSREVQLAQAQKQNEQGTPLTSALDRAALYIHTECLKRDPNSGYRPTSQYRLGWLNGKNLEACRAQVREIIKLINDDIKNSLPAAILTDEPTLLNGALYAENDLRAESRRLTSIITNGDPVPTLPPPVAMSGKAREWSHPYFD